MLGHGHAAGGDLARGSDHFTGDNMTSTPAVGTLRATHLRVLLADEDVEALERLGDVLAELGHEVMSFAVSVQEAADLIVREDPDLAIVVVDRDDEHALALIGESVELASGPVIAQLREGDVDFVARAAERGISAYVASNDPEHVQAAIEVAVRRYREAALLHDKIGQLEGALDRRAVIERAKGMLMERHGVDEREAFERLRDHARATSRRVVDVAEGVLDGHVLRPRH
jgi:AmiR/NasT family two-component response regulator